MSAWLDVRLDFSRTVRRIQRMSSTVETQADFTRMLSDQLKYKEVLELMEGLKHNRVQEIEPLKSNNVPTILSPKFWGREKGLGAIQAVLKPQDTPAKLKAFALCGIGVLERPRSR